MSAAKCGRAKISKSLLHPRLRLIGPQRAILKLFASAAQFQGVIMQISYAIGIAHPISVSIETFGTGKVSDERILGLVEQHFDLRPGAIIENLGLRRPIYRQTAAYGHFGRPELDLPWERTDRAAALAADAGLRMPEPVGVSAG